ncbi:MAG: hypothetical protein ABFD50_21930 [Smithella sp.]
MKPSIFVAAVIVLCLSFMMPGTSPAAPPKPCECKNIKDIEKSIKEDEYLQKRYAERAAAYQQQIDEYKAVGRIPSSLVNRQVDEYSAWATQELPQEFSQAMGYKGPVYKISPDPKNPYKIDKRKMDAYKKTVACREILDSVEAHENFHIDTTKAIESGTKKISSAVDLAKEEVSAYEAGLRVMRSALENLRKKCGNWLCRCNQQRYSSAVECSAKCPPARLGKCVAPTCIQIDPKTGRAKPGLGRMF